MRKVSLLLATTMLCGGLLGPPADAQTETAPSTEAVPVRVAIVVGNQDYENVKDLPNAARDAADMAALLRQFGFEVHEGTNLDRRGFEQLIRDALLNLPEGSEVVFFYAGHGIQIGARNYLLPTDVAFTSVNDLPVYSITLDRVIDVLAARGSIHVVFIDACRDNPFPGVKLTADLAANLVETGQGFAAYPAPLNSLVAFSTSPGQTAVDGPQGDNSPYTDALMTTVEAAPDKDLSVLLPRIREQVYAATGGTQVPWESSTLVRPFQFAVPGMGPGTTAPEIKTGGTERGGTTDPAQLDAQPSEQSVPLTLMLDRVVDLAPALAAAGLPPLQDATLTGLPVNGEVSVLAGGKVVLYRPTLREIRTPELAQHSHTDRLLLETGPADARITLALDLELAADPCDLQAGDALDLDGVGLFRLPNEIDAAAAVAACEAALAAHPDVARFRYQLGRAHLAQADFTAAIKDFRLAGNAGHIRAWNAEATLLLTDKIDRSLVDIPADPERAVELQERGIASGDPFAMHGRGLRLLREGTTDQDRQRGFELMDRAAELGHTYSMNGLGIYFLTKDTDHYQPDRGMTYLRVSYDRDDIYGMHSLGYVALYGLDGQPPDPARAAPFFEAAAMGGHPLSPATLGRMIMRKELGPVDHAKALTWYDMGLARGDGWGGTNGADVILMGQLPGFGPPDAAARAAKATLLADKKAADAAAKLLDKLDDAAIGGGLQRILADLGLPVTVDGKPGAETLKALDQAARDAGLSAKAGSDRDRLILAARIWWKKHPVRSDLF